ncbi:MAG: hypothetical protein HY235_19340 [Acidobacteria bacterium]|nr:hypothetical protein [Acidobacteriota bacterium]
MNQRIGMTMGVIGLFLTAVAPGARGQDQPEGFSWTFGPVDLHPGQTAKLIFGNLFCQDNPLKEVVLAFVDLTGRPVQLRGSAQPVPKKRTLVKCGDSIQLELAGREIVQQGTIIGVLEVIPDRFHAWVPVTVPLGSLQVGRATGDSFEPSVVVPPNSPIRRLVLE